jgi:hypothetical protein
MVDNGTLPRSVAAYTAAARYEVVFKSKSVRSRGHKIAGIH